MEAKLGDVIVPECGSEQWQVSYFSVTEHEAALFNVYHAKRESQYVKAGDYARLIQITGNNRIVMMSNTPMGVISLEQDDHIPF